MAPPARGGPQPQRKTSAHDLERIRINQQRSRDRKRAYIAELEQKVQDLTTQLQTRAGDAATRLTPASENEDRALSSASVQLDSAHEVLMYENAIRSNLLIALGVDDNAQRQFLNASMRGKDSGRHWLGIGESHGSPSLMQMQEAVTPAVENTHGGDADGIVSRPASVATRQKQPSKGSVLHLSIPEQHEDATHPGGASSGWTAGSHNASWGSSAVSSEAYQQDLGIGLPHAAVQYAHPTLHMTSPNIPAAIAQASDAEGPSSLGLATYQIDSSTHHTYHHATRDNSPRFTDVAMPSIPGPTTQASDQDMSLAASATVPTLSTAMWTDSNRSSGCCSNTNAICPESINVLMKIHPLPAAASDPDAPYASSEIVRPYSQGAADLKQSCLNYCLAVRQCCSPRNAAQRRHGTHSVQRSPSGCVDACGSTPGDASSTSDEDTTACAIAFSVIYQNNMRGYTLAELESRLHDGYRWGDGAQSGCRVVNRVLFQVLAEIS
ncbi:hypothetical protein MRB53_041987 [Persea americana]|nr:hypothetical protein MRB53_041987 [Persea americana]